MCMPHMLDMASTTDSFIFVFSVQIIWSMSLQHLSLMKIDQLREILLTFSEALHIFSLFFSSVPYVSVVIYLLFSCALMNERLFTITIMIMMTIIEGIIYSRKIARNCSLDNSPTFINDILLVITYSFS